MAFDPQQQEEKSAAAQPTKEERAASAKEERAALEAERVYRRGITTLRDLIAPAAMKVEADHLRLGTKYLRTLFVTNYPRYIEVGWFSPIINFPATLDQMVPTWSVASLVAVTISLFNTLVLATNASLAL